MPTTNPKLLIHLCCAPCGTYVIELLRSKFDLLCYFYNPNIHPEKEYFHRLEDAKEYTKKVGVKLLWGEYDAKKWFDAIRGLEHEPEGGKRCEVCYRMRLKKTADFAVKTGYMYFTTTLSISPYKKAQVINQIGSDIAKDFPTLEFYEADFKKRDGFKISMKMSKEASLYRQDYCGCIFSKREREAKRY